MSVDDKNLPRSSRDIPQEFDRAIEVVEDAGTKSGVELRVIHYIPDIIPHKPQQRKGKAVPDDLTIRKIALSHLYSQRLHASTGKLNSVSALKTSQIDDALTLQIFTKDQF
jgi:hypothetical protein